MPDQPKGAKALTFRQALEVLDTYTTDTEADPAAAAREMEDGQLADAIAEVQDLRRRLGDVERDLTVELGQRLGKTTGNLSDGRQFTLHRTSDRKEWDHDDWKRDVRRRVVEKTLAELAEGDSDGRDLAIVNTATGQEVGPLGGKLYQALGEAQAVHGAQAPKSTALKALGLYASDYCTSQPGSWKFTALAPTTTEENTADV